MRKMTIHSSVSHLPDHQRDARESVFVEGGVEHRAQVIHDADGRVVGLSIYGAGGRLERGLEISKAKFSDDDGKWHAVSQPSL
jgi:hypothetical protein